MYQYSYGNGSYADPNLNHPFFAAAEVSFPASSSSSLPSSNDNLMHRSSSTHSLAHHACIPDPVAMNPFYSSSSSPPVSSACDFLDFHRTDEPVRRVYNTGDLQVSTDNCTTQEAIAAAAAGRVSRYSAEERKERIERYRSKRNHRNFHKKITYACRKTLADSRPRVRGRFARNGETETEAEVEAESSDTSFECYSYGTCDNGGSHNISENSAGGGEWWKQMQAALTTTDEEECCYDADIWANLDSVFSVNLLS